MLLQSFFLKTILVSCLAHLLCVGLMAQKVAKTQTLEVKTHIYCDHCKQCETCGERLQKGLLAEGGVKMITIDDAVNTIFVIYNTKKITPTQIRNKISLLGYDADDIPATTIGVTQLDACCKKIE